MTKQTAAKKQSNSIEKLAKKNPELYERLVSENLISNKKVEDDIELNGLEKKLKIKNGKLPESFKEDGLDYLFNGDDSEAEPSDHSAGESEGSNASESEKENEELDASQSEKESLQDEFEEDFLDEQISEKDEKEEDSDEESDTVIEGSAQVDKSSMKTEKYIPPHLRESESEEISRLKKSMQGLLNRLCESNIESIFHSIEEIFLKYKRKNVLQVFSNLVIQFISDHVNLIDSFVIGYAALINLVWTFVGSEVGAHFIQKIVEDFIKLNYKEERVCMNLISLLCQLYNFQVSSCILIYDLIKEMIGGMQEIQIEILLKIIRTCGSQLRQDDPNALKEIVLLLSGKSVDTKSTRFKFMIETIMDLKNNKKKFENEEVSRLKKFIHSILKRRNASSLPPFRISLEDIKSIESKGRWWLVGSTWSGKESSVISKISSKNDSKVMQLATKQKMNTDVRKSVFSILVTSADYLDAFERLINLKLKDKQEREIPRVILHCCSQEKEYNPFYALVALKFCELNHSFKITFQFCFWDLIKDLSKTNDRKLSNLAKFYAYLISKLALSIFILKTTSFEKLKEKLIFFFQIFFAEVLKSENFLQIFSKLKGNGEFEVLKDGILLFLTSVLKGDFKKQVRLVKECLSE